MAARRRRIKSTSPSNSSILKKIIGKNRQETAGILESQGIMARAHTQSALKQRFMRKKTRPPSKAEFEDFAGKHFLKFSIRTSPKKKGRIVERQSCFYLSKAQLAKAYRNPEKYVEELKAALKIVNKYIMAGEIEVWGDYGETTAPPYEISIKPRELFMDTDETRRVQAAVGFVNSILVTTAMPEFRNAIFQAGKKPKRR